MNIESEDFQSLFQSVCDRVRVSARQTPNAIVRQSRERLKIDQGDHSAWCVVAAASLVNQGPQRSLELLRRAPELLKRDGVGNRLAGYAALALKQAEKAREYFDRAVQIDPHQPDCWNLLGQIAEQGDDPSQAAEYYERGIVFDDASHLSSHSLSKLQAKSNLLHDAIHTLRVSLMQDPRSPSLNCALAQLLERRLLMLRKKHRPIAQQKIREEVLSCYKIANACRPAVRSLLGQARMQQQLFDYDGARATYAQAVEIAPDSALALHQAASANVDCGEINLAHDQFEKSIAIDPSSPDAHFQYTRAKKFKPGKKTDRYAELLRQQLSDPKWKPRQLIHLHFSLAKVLDDSGCYDESWKHYDLGNRLKQGHSETVRIEEAPSDGSGFEASSLSEPRPSKPSPSTAQSMIEFFTKEFFDRNSHIGNPSQTPVFVVGMPRSGTTLCEQILSSHPEIAGAGELTYINQIRQSLLRRSANRSGARQISYSAYPGVLAETPVTQLRDHADDYLSRLGKFGNGERRISDKMPTNFLHLGMIGLLFPGATIVHCRRNPLDVMVSCYCQNLNAPFCDLEQLVVYHRNYRNMMKHFESVLPIKIHSVDYESMVADPESNTRALIEHCGLDWNDRCLSHQSNGRAVHTPSKWQVRQPMYRSSVEKWRRFEEQFAPIARQVEAELLSEQCSDSLEVQAA